MDKHQNMKNTTYLKKLSAIVLATSLTAAGTAATLPFTQSSAYAASTSSSAKSVINVQVEGKAISAKGMLSKSGSTLLPLKDIAKTVGATITYDSKAHTATITKGKNKVSYDLNDQNGVFVRLNGSAVGDSYDASVIKGTTYVAIKAVTEPFGYRALWNNATRTVNVTAAGMNDVEVTGTKLVSSIQNKYTNVNIVYPVVSGVENKAAQTAINKALKAHYDTFLTTMEKQVKEAGAPTNKDMIYEIDGGYKVTYNRNGVISFLLTDYQYLGGAHGDNILTSMTFSLKDGKAIKLDDLLKSNKNYSQDIKKLIQAHIKKNANTEGLSLEQFNDLSKSSSKYLDNYYLTDSGVTIFFQKYDIAPGAAGNPEVEFTFSQLLKSGTNPLSAYQS
ncbi:PdaC/SigV domain-containing protein [Paenibacillus sp. Z6-24]